jgi:predicted acyl esterase
MKKERVMSRNPDAVFGGRLDTGVQFSDVIEYVKAMRPSALTTDAMPDVIDILEYTREQVLKLHQETEALSRALQEKQQALLEREAELNVRAKAWRLVRSETPPRGETPKRRYFWR